MDGRRTRCLRLGASVLLVMTLGLSLADFPLVGTSSAHAAGNGNGGGNNGNGGGGNNGNGGGNAGNNGNNGNGGGNAGNNGNNGNGGGNAGNNGNNGQKPDKPSSSPRQNGLNKQQGAKPSAPQDKLQAAIDRFSEALEALVLSRQTAEAARSAYLNAQQDAQDAAAFVEQLKADMKKSGDNAKLKSLLARAQKIAFNTQANEQSALSDYRKAVQNMQEHERLMQDAETEVQAMQKKFKDL